MSKRAETLVSEVSRLIKEKILATGFENSKEGLSNFMKEKKAVLFGKAFNVAILRNVPGEVQEILLAYNLPEKFKALENNPQGISLITRQTDMSIINASKKARIPAKKSKRDALRALYESELKEVNIIKQRLLFLKIKNNNNAKDEIEAVKYELCKIENILESNSERQRNLAALLT